MAKVDRPLFSDEASGRIGTTASFRKDTFWHLIVPQFHRTRSPSAPLAAHRARYSTACKAWRLLTPAEKQQYKDAAPDNWTGFQYYLNQNL